MDCHFFVKVTVSNTYVPFSFPVTTVMGKMNATFVYNIFLPIRAGMLIEDKSDSEQFV
jgi:hypothetical protein|tara:strand:- start:92 stop:265 length:174 start_codon:yes stop_codon:yes gene_type:complete